MTLVAPQYTPQPGYTQSGIYFGFNTVGTGARGNIAKAIANLDSHIQGIKPNWKGWEMLSMGLSNQMTGDTAAGSSAMQSLLNAPHHVVWAAPAVPFNGTVVGNMTALVNGAYDTNIDNIAAAFNAFRQGGVNDTIRIGWEYNFANYPWGVGKTTTDGVTNTVQLVAAGLSHYIKRIRNPMVPGTNTPAAPYIGRIDLCGAFKHASGPTGVVAYMDAQTIGYIDIYGKDLYNNIITQANLNNRATISWQTVWDTEMHANLNGLRDEALAAGKLIGFGEGGTQITNDAGHAGDSTNFWALLHDWIVNESQGVVTYYCNYNQNGGGEENASWFWGTPTGTAAAGTWPNFTNLGVQQNSQPLTPVVDNPSTTRTNTQADWYNSMTNSGDLQQPSGTPVTPPPVFTIPQVAAAQKSVPLLNLSLFG